MAHGFSPSTLPVGGKSCRSRVSVFRQHRKVRAREPLRKPDAGKKRQQVIAVQGAFFLRGRTQITQHGVVQLEEGCEQCALLLFQHIHFAQRRIASQEETYLQTLLLFYYLQIVPEQFDNVCTSAV